MPPQMESTRNNAFEPRNIRSAAKTALHVCGRIRALRSVPRTLEELWVDLAGGHDADHQLLFEHHVAVHRLRRYARHLPIGELHERVALAARAGLVPGQAHPRNPPELAEKLCAPKLIQHAAIGLGPPSQELDPRAWARQLCAPHAESTLSKLPNMATLILPACRAFWQPTDASQAHQAAAHLSFAARRTRAGHACGTDSPGVKLHHGLVQRPATSSQCLWRFAAWTLRRAIRARHSSNFDNNAACIDSHQALTLCRGLGSSPLRGRPALMCWRGLAARPQMRAAYLLTAWSVCWAASHRGGWGRRLSSSEWLSATPLLARQ